VQRKQLGKETAQGALCVGSWKTPVFPGTASNANSGGGSRRSRRFETGSGSESCFSLIEHERKISDLEFSVRCCLAQQISKSCGQVVDGLPVEKVCAVLPGSSNSNWFSINIEILRQGERKIKRRMIRGDRILPDRQMRQLECGRRSILQDQSHLKQRMAGLG